MLRWPLWSIFALFPELQLRDLVSWESRGKWFMIGHSSEVILVLCLFVLKYFSTVWCSVADSHLKLLDAVVRGASFFSRRCFGLQSCPSTICGSVVRICYLRSRVTRCIFWAMHCSCRICSGALVPNWQSFAPPHCRTSHYRRIFVLLSFSL